MVYDIHRLKENLVYIRLTGQPMPADDVTYLSVVTSLLDEAEQPQYFLVDFRKGLTREIGTIRALAELAKSPKFGDSIAFASLHIQETYTSLFNQFRQAENDEGLHLSPEKALAALEKRQPGITAGLDWEAIFS